MVVFFFFGGGGGCDRCLKEVVGMAEVGCGSRRLEWAEVGCGYG